MNGLSTTPDLLTRGTATHTSNLVDLLQKYDIRAPRYTSYPPATLFTPKFTEKHYLEYLTQVTSEDSIENEISLYFHLPFCDTLCYFCGCTMMVTHDRNRIAEYLQYLKREVTLVAETLSVKPRVIQMHWGGGSPTYLTPDEIRDLGEHIRKHFNFSDDAEVSIEIDPRGLTFEHVQALHDVGFRRASIGVQDFDPNVQIAINREQSKALTSEVIDWCRALDIEGINLDLIYGLPFQSRESFDRTLDGILDLAPDRVAVYNFAFVPWLKPHQNLIQIETLPETRTKLQLLADSIGKLTTSGYQYIGMDHFARPGDTLAQAQQSGTLQRNFQGYSTHGGKDLMGFGLSAIGRMENCFVQNTKNLPEYYKAIDRGSLPVERGYIMNTDDGIREYAIMQLMCNSRLEKAQTEHLFDLDFSDYFGHSLSKLEELADDGLCADEGDAVSVTDQGRYFLRNIAACFDAYYDPNNKQFSKAI